MRKRKKTKKKIKKKRTRKSEPHDVVQGAILKNLVVKEVVREPATLLPEEADQGRGDESGVDGPREQGQDANGGGQDRAVEQHLEGVVELVALEQSHVLEGGPELAGIADKLCFCNK